MAELPQDVQQWNNSTGFTALLELNKKFLRGKISSSPYHYGPIEEETHSLSTIFTRMQERRRRQILRPLATTFYLLYCGREKQPAETVSRVEKKKDIKVHARKAYSLEAALRGSFTKKKIVTKYRRSFFPRRWKALTDLDPAADIAEEDIFCLKAMKQADPWEFEVVAASWKDVDITGIVIDAIDAAQA
ncbi:hypothetical protein N7536_000086 [Penicillium majusculum]|nr:hypothetical protein N7536_000086 [Penicillium majusculum]